MTVHVLQGYFAFRFWLPYRPRMHRTPELADAGFVGKSSHIRVRLDGLECFVYNRTSAYDQLLNLFAQDDGAESQQQDVKQSTKHNKDIWPMEVVGTIGSIIVGNPDLPSIMTLSYKELFGVYSETPEHHAKTHLHLINAKLSIRINVDYKEPTLNFAARMRTQNRVETWSHRLRSFLYPVPEPENNIPLSEPLKWEGLQRYQDAAENSKVDPSLEYAQVPDILVCKLMDITTIADDVGKCDVAITDGTINYGAWTQRQRNIIQGYFSPPSYRNQKFDPLNPGESRLPIIVTFFGQCLFRIPTREASKDNEVATTNTENVFFNATDAHSRHYGWIEILFSPRSTLELHIPRAAAADGFKTTFALSFFNPIITTSVNFRPWITGKHFKMEVNYHSPLQWNGLRDVGLAFTLTECEVFFLREHITLVMDIVKDLNSLPPPPIEYHTPSIYNITLDLPKTKFIFNLNPLNIIQDHNSFETNTMLTLYCESALMAIRLSFEKYQPDFRIAKIDSEFNGVSFTSSFPSNHKLSSFLLKDWNKLIVMRRWVIDARYEYHPFNPAATDILTLIFDSEDVELNAHGHLMPTALSLIRNLVGEFSVVNTLQAYQEERMRRPFVNPQQNGFELHFGWQCKGVKVLMPCSMYGNGDSLTLKTNTLQLDMYTKPFGQDIHVSFAPISILWEDSTIILRDVQVAIQRFTAPPSSVLLAANWTFHLGVVRGDIQPLFIDKVRDAAHSFSFHMGDVDPIVKKFVDSRTDARSASTFEFFIRKLEIWLRVDTILTRLLLPKGVISHLSNCLFVDENMARFVHVPLFIISSLQLPADTEPNQMNSKMEYAAEVFRFETSIIIDNKSAPDNSAELSKSQLDFLFQGNEEIGHIISPLLNQSTRRSKSSPAANKSLQFSVFKYRLPMLFLKDLYERPSNEPVDFVSDPQHLLHRVPAALTSITYADHLSIFEIESSYASRLSKKAFGNQASGGNTYSRLGKLKLAKHPQTPPLDLRSEQTPYRIWSTVQAAPGENQFSIRFTRPCSVILTHLSLKAIVKAVETFKSEQSQNTTDEFDHVLDLLERMHHAYQNKEEGFSYLNVFSVFFSTIHVRLISTTSSPRESACVIDFVADSFKGSAKTKDGEFTPGEVEMSLGSIECAVRVKEKPQYETYEHVGLPKTTWVDSEIWHLIRDPIGVYVTVKEVNLKFQIGTSPRNLLVLSKVETNAVDSVYDVLIHQIQLWKRFASKVHSSVMGVLRSTSNVMQIALSVVSIYQETNELNAVEPPTTYINSKLVDGQDSLGLLLVYMRFVRDIVKRSRRYELVKDRAPQLLAVGEGNILVLCQNILRKWGVTNSTPFPAWFEQIIDPSSRPVTKPFQNSLRPAESRLSAVLGILELSIFDKSNHMNTFRVTNTRIQPRFKPVTVSVANGGSLNLSEISAVVSIESIEQRLYPNFMAFVLDTMKNRKSNSPLVSGPSSDNNTQGSDSLIEAPLPTRDTQHLLSISALLLIDKIVVVVRENNAEVSVRLDKMVVSLRKGHNALELSSLLVDPLELSVYAGVQKTSVEFSERRASFDVESDSDALFSATILKASFTLSRSKLPDSETVACIAVSNIQFILPRSLVKIQIFLEKLQAEDIPRYSSALKNAVVLPKLESLSVNTSLEKEKLMIDILIDKISVKCDLLTYFRFSYELTNITISSVNKRFSELLVKSRYLYRISKQIVNFSSPVSCDVDASTQNGVLPLPTSFSVGKVIYTRDVANVPWNSFYDGHVALENIDTTLGVDVVDQLLTTYTVLTSELQEALRVVQFFSNRKRLVQADMQKGAAPEPPEGLFKFAMKLTVMNMSIKADAVPNSLVFSSKILNGSITNEVPTTSKLKFMWCLTGDGLSVSLVHRASQTNFLHTLASVDTDVQLQNWQEHHSDSGKKGRHDGYNIIFSKIIAIMQPVGIGSFAEFITFWKTALNNRQELQKEGIDEIRQGTKNLIDSLNLHLPETMGEMRIKADASPVRLKIDNLAVAIPLVDHFEGEMDLMKQEVHSEAVLLHLRSVDIERGSVSNADISELSIQFVPRFNPLEISDFDPSNHFSQNSAHLPLVHVKLTEKRFNELSYFKVESDVEGFIVNLNASISNKINSLVNIYRNGRRIIDASFPTASREEASRLSRLTKRVGRLQNAIRDAPKYIRPASAAKTHAANECIIVSLKTMSRFASGRISIEKDMKGKTSPGTPTFNNGGAEIENLFLPGITISSIGNAVLGNDENVIESFKRGLFVDVSIDPTENTISPTIIGFFEDIAENIRLNQMQEQVESAKATQEASPTPEKSPAGPRQQQNPEESKASVEYRKHALCLVLRLAQTKVNLTCQPFTKVVYTFSVEKADFFFSLIPQGALAQSHRYLNCTGTAKGMRSALRHIFSSEDCLRSDIPVIHFSSTFDQGVKGGSSFLTTVSVPGCSGHINVRQMQDLFLFERIWIRKKYRTTQTNKSGDELYKSDGAPKAPKSIASSIMGFKIESRIAVAVCVDKIDVTADIGPSLGRGSILLENIVAGSENISHGFQPISMLTYCTIGLANASVEGRLSGTFSLQKTNLLSRSMDPQDSVSGIHGTSISVSFDKIEANVQYQSERIAIFELYPLIFVVQDEWGEVVLNHFYDIQINTVRFVVSKNAGPRFIQFFTRLKSTIRDKAVSAKIYLTKTDFDLNDDLASQKEISLPAKPRRVFTIDKLGKTIEAKVRLRCTTCFATTSRNNFRDSDCAQVNLSGVEVSLSEIPMLFEKAREVTGIQFERLAIKKSSLKAVSQQEERMWSASQWLTFLSASAGSDVVQIPDFKMQMNSESDFQKNIAGYSLQTDFGGRIYVALNLGLYKYLQDLVSSYVKAVSKVEEERENEMMVPRIPTASSTISVNTNVTNSTMDDGTFSDSMKSPISPTIMGQIPVLISRNNTTATVNVIQRPKVTLSRTGDLIFEPQLNITGDATPKELLENVLGLDKEQIPKVVYESVTLKLSDLWKQAAKVYKAVVIKPVEDGFVSPSEGAAGDASSIL